jgi:hypothetical protein
MDGFMVIKFTGESLKILLKITSKYKAYVRYEIGQRVLYTRLNKVLYDWAKSALLWYEFFYITLQGIGFEWEPHDSYNANGIIKGLQCPIAWFINNTEILLKKFRMVTNVIKQLEQHFEKVTVTRDMNHVVLGMSIKATQ